MTPITKEDLLNLLAKDTYFIGTQGGMVITAREVSKKSLLRLIDEFYEGEVARLELDREHNMRAMGWTYKIPSRKKRKTLLIKI